MAKRFMESNIWDDSWFMELSPEYKCAWMYICSKCDVAGFWNTNERALDFYIGTSLTLEDCLLKFNTPKKIRVVVEGEYWFIVDFIEFQYGKLSPACAPHKKVIAVLESHGMTSGDVQQKDSYSFKRPIVKALRDAVLERDKNICGYCGKEVATVDITIDHLRARCNGGQDRINNLMVSCLDCNTKKGMKSLEEFIPLCDNPKRVLNTLFSRVNYTLQEEEEDKDKDKDSIQGGAGGKSDGYTLEQCLEAADKLNIPAREAESFHLHYSPVDWIDGSRRKITNLSGMLQKWHVNQAERGNGKGVRRKGDPDYVEYR